jgi:hypothetical protein
MKPDLGSVITGFERFLAHLPLLQVDKALVDLAAAPGVGFFGGDEPFGHNGPNYWTGSLALPMIVQHENAAIIAYNIPSLQRNFSGAATHAWFPKWAFDSTDKQDKDDGTWFFGEKVTIDPITGERTGSGYVALYSARKADWTNEDGNVWNDKEIQAYGGSNIWICMVGNEKTFESFDAFKKQVADSYLHVSGVGSPYQLQCSFDIPGASAPAGRSPRLELFYDDKKGRFAGDDLQLDEFPRFENRYMVQTKVGPWKSGSLGPQVERFGRPGPIDFGARSYVITHDGTQLTLAHDLDLPARSYTTQPDTRLQQAVREWSPLLDELKAFRGHRRPADFTRHPLGPAGK